MKDPIRVRAAHRAWRTIRLNKLKRHLAAKKAWRTIRANA